MKFNKYRLLVIILFCGVLLAACAEKTDKKGEATSGDGKVELTVATWANEREAKEFDEILAAINESQDEYKLKQMVIPKDYYVKIQTMIAGKNAPDLMWLAQEYIPAYAKNKAIVDLTEQLNTQSKIDMTDYLPGSLDTAIYQDKTYGLPWIGQPYVVYYNKTMFTENDVALPENSWTWNEFKETARQLTNDDVYGFASTGSVPLAVFAWGEDGDIIDKDGKVQLTSSETIKGLEIASDLYADNTTTMPYTEAESLGVEQGFVNGKIGMMIGGANDDVEKKVEEAGKKFEVGMAVMPSGSVGQVTFNWTASTVISEQTKYKDEAFAALLAITTEMFAWKVPAPVASKVNAIAEINPYKQYALSTIERSTEISRGFNNLPEQNELAGKQWDLLDVPIISNNNGKGNVNVKEVAEKTAEQFNKILK